MTYRVAVFDGNIARIFPAVDWVKRNRLVDSAFRHSLRFAVSETPARPSRRSYR